MYDSIQGRLSVREPARVVVEAAGLGYLLEVPLSTFDALPAPGADVRLLLHLVVREDVWRLFGFGSGRERDVFRDLLRVSGVGPVVALALLSGLGPEPLVRAVAEGDARALTRVKGVGKKTAERIVLDLKDRWGGEAFRRGAAAGGLARPGAGPQAEAVRALEALGLERGEAEERVARLLADPGAAGSTPPSVAELVRRALRG